MKHSTAAIILILLLAGFLNRPARAQDLARPTDAQVDALIKQLQERILSRQINQASLLVRPDGAGPGPDGQRPLHGDVIETSPAGLKFKADGQVKSYTWNQVATLEYPGHFGPNEVPHADNPGGITAMSMWALVSSGMDPKDPRMKTAIDGYAKAPPFTGTYAESFRINTLSYMVRWYKPNQSAALSDLHKALAAETPYLWKGADRTGMYDYCVFPNPLVQPWIKFDPAMKVPPDAQWGSDHSNSQFGVYGVWAAEDAAIEVPAAYWELIDKHWREAQDGSGGWYYNHEVNKVTSNMTDAGMNSLYLVVNMYWSNKISRAGYQHFRGFTYDEKAYKGMMQTFTSINNGWKYIEGNPPDGDTHWGLYREYGMQRLGLISGRKYIGGRNWFDEVMEKAYRNGAMDTPGVDPMTDDCWRLMCFAFGRAPVLFEKLQHGTDEMDWNYYFRDLASLTDWINHETEKRHNWQVVSLDNDLYDLQDAPILVISGYKAITLTDPQKAKLKQYCDLGGTVLLHPNNNSEVFKTSAVKLFQDLYKTEGYEFVHAAKTDPIYTAQVTPPKLAMIPVREMSDGARNFVYLVDADLAGAWQLKMTKTEKEAHDLMMNLRISAAPSYEELPTRLRPHETLGQITKHATVARIKHEGQSDCNSMLYDAMKADLSQAGVDLTVKPNVEATDANLADVQIIHITGHLKFKLTDPQVAAIKTALGKGAFLLIDPAWGKSDFDKSAHDLVTQLGLTTAEIKPADEPLFKDVAIHPNKWMITSTAANSGFSTLTLNGKSVGLLSDVDITASATGQFVWGAPAFGKTAARKLWENIAASVAK